MAGGGVAVDVHVDEFLLAADQNDDDDGKGDSDVDGDES